MKTPDLPDTDFMRGPLLVLLGSFAFSTIGSTRALLMPEASSFDISLVRSIGGGLLLFAVCAYRGFLIQLWQWRSWCTMQAFSALLGLLWFQLLFFAALEEAGVTIGTVVTIGTMPVAVGFLGWLFLKEAPKRVWYLATILALISLVLLAFSKSVVEEQSSLTGVCLAVAGGGSYGVFVVQSKRLLTTREPEVLMTGVFLGCAVFQLGYALMVPDALDLSWLASPSGLAGTTIMLVFSTSLAYVLTLTGLRRTPVALTATLALSEPVCAAFWGITLLGEPMTLWSSVGMGLMFVSMFMLSKR